MLNFSETTKTTKLQGKNQKMMGTPYFPHVSMARFPNFLHVTKGIQKSLAARPTRRAGKPGRRPPMQGYWDGRVEVI